MSLRAGRRNLHTRICQYLRSPRTAKFSHESMLKQEEALAELDSSIDEWVTKLEQAENRRTRVRQKLLEHVAAAATLSLPAGGVVGVSETLQLAMGVRPPSAHNISTPPRSPTKTPGTHTPCSSSSPSPQRGVAHVPSTIVEQPLFEDEAVEEEEAAAAATSTDARDRTSKAPLRRAETIRVYADTDVYALLADVENTISNMGAVDAPAKESLSSSPSSSSPKWDAEARPHPSRSYEMLRGPIARKPLPISKLEEKPSYSSLSSSATAPPGPTPPTAASEPATEEIYLTSAVFRPER